MSLSSPPTPTGTTPPHHSLPAHKPKLVSLSDIMKEQQTAKEQDKTRPVPKLREIMGQELTSKMLSAPHDAIWEQKMLELAIQASLEDH